MEEHRNGIHTVQALSLLGLLRNQLLIVLGPAVARAATVHYITLRAYSAHARTASILEHFNGVCVCLCVIGVMHFPSGALSVRVL